MAVAVVDLCLLFLFQVFCRNRKTPFINKFKLYTYIHDRSYHHLTCLRNGCCGNWSFFWFITAGRFIPELPILPNTWRDNCCCCCMGSEDEGTAPFMMSLELGITAIVFSPSDDIFTKRCFVQLDSTHSSLRLRLRSRADMRNTAKDAMLEFCRFLSNSRR